MPADISGQNYSNIGGALNGSLVNGVIGDASTLQLQGQAQLQSNYIQICKYKMLPKDCKDR